MATPLSADDGAEGVVGQVAVARAGRHPVRRLHQDPARVHHGAARHDQPGAVHRRGQTGSGEGGGGQIGVRWGQMGTGGG